MKFLVSFLILMPFLTRAQHNKEDSTFNAEARAMIKESIKKERGKKVITHGPIHDKQAAIEVAEPILFSTYGKKQILGEKPYVVRLIDNYWVLEGSLPEGYLGGTFFIILSAKDGRVIKLTHYK